MFKVLTLNNIAVVGLDRLPRDNYEVASEIQNPDAILLRSFKMHDMDLPETVNAIGRAGAGVNNIPVDKMSGLGVPVFNAPGANANAVKELVVAGMLLAARNITGAWNYVQELEGSDEDLSKKVEAGKKAYKGYELPGRTLGVIGLGAIGVKIANTAVKLGMNVVGFDPSMTVKNAWQLDAQVKQAVSVDDLMGQCDFITFHVPLNDHTRNLLNADRIKLLNDGAVVLNFARGGVVDDEAVMAALDSGKLSAYVNDFPTNTNKAHPKVIALPHLGASTDEAEDNCAVMVADQVRDFMENGNVLNSVNFPETFMPRTDGARLSIVNDNVPNMVGQISSCLANHSMNIVDMLNKSRGDLAYTLIDLEQGEIGDDVLAELRAIAGVRKVRAI